MATYMMGYARSIHVCDQFMDNLPKCCEWFFFSVSTSEALGQI